MHFAYFAAFSLVDRAKGLSCGSGYREQIDGFSCTAPGTRSDCRMRNDEAACVRPHGQVNIGGGQMTTCRQLLRTGQLMLNQGTWLNAQGQPFPLVSADFMCDTHARLARDTRVVCVGGAWGYFLNRMIRESLSETRSIKGVALIDCEPSYIIDASSPACASVWHSFAATRVCTCTPRVCAAPPRAPPCPPALVNPNDRELSKAGTVCVAGTPS